MTKLPDLKSVIRDVLTEAGIEADEAHAEVELIAEHVTKLSPTEQILFAGAVPDQWLADVEVIIRKRLERTPIQYILGEAYFCGLNFEVKPGVFIPRSDTEAVVEKAISIIQKAKVKRPRIVDIGCGSGAIAISLAKAIPAAKVYAIEISAIALGVARSNAARHQVDDKIEFLQSDWRKSLPFDLDLIVSNPPYIPRHKAKDLMPEVVDNEPHLALFGGDRDGLGHYRDFARLFSPHFAQAGGFVCLEVGDMQAPSVATIFKEREWTSVEITKDLNGHERVVSAWSPKIEDVKKT
ncbi:MAG: peptide chain release factor N(5)-glutamine methyltransferase [Candidatus Obscuribacterales bacterium]|nr:peptide chain release factor N(5)-glutamine methyltransferase [Candidatus Obscuribacterales bacterium]